MKKVGKRRENFVLVGDWVKRCVLSWPAEGFGRAIKRYDVIFAKNEWMAETGQ